MDNQPSRPANDSWVAAVHRSEADVSSLGSAFVLDANRVLSCAHVVRAAADAGAVLWVAFPKAEESGIVRIRVWDIVLPPAELQLAQDVAILRLAEPVPAPCVPRLRCPVPADMVGRDWWAFGFPGGELLGNSAAGEVGEALGYGWVRLDTNSRYTVKSGFSGSAMWSPEYEAIVGMVGQASGDGDARAMSLWQVDRIFPGEQIADLASWTVEAAGESALASWGWSLRHDPEAGRHWRPRARGVSIDTEKGFRFRGRTAALTAIVDWVNSAPKRKALVLTGSPGVGKSAVLGRIVTTADCEIAALLPGDDTALRAPVGSISCAVHAKGKTALDVAVEIAAAASAALPDDIEYLPEYLREALRSRVPAENNGPPASFTVVIDALDEAASPQQVRLIIRRIIAPLVETCTDLNVRVIVGSRRRDDSGDLLAPFGRALSLVDLDQPGFFEQEDLRSYTLATLQMVGDKRQDNPYADDAVAEPVARRIAAMADRNFLVAGLVARAHGLHDAEAVRPEDIAFIPTVDGALRDYLDRIQPVQGCSAESVLTALAFAEAPGFSPTLWRMAITALGGPSIPDTALTAFARSSAANFLVETGGQESGVVYRLFHQALNDTLISARAELHTRREDERSLALAMIVEGGRTGWTDADRYLKRSLPGHAEAGEVLDELLAEEVYLLHADLRRLLPVADRAVSALARTKTKFIRRTAQAFNADPSQRIALFSVTEAQQRLGSVYREMSLPAPYRASWSTVVPGREEAVLNGHTRWSYVLRPFTSGGRQLLASAGGDRTVRVWDPVLGEVLHVMEGHTDEVRSIVSLRLGTMDALASAGRDGSIRFWDPSIGEPLHDIGGDAGGYSALCALTHGGRTLLAAARAADAAIRLLDPVTGEQVAQLDGHDEWITDLCEVVVDGVALLASCSEDGTVRLWDPATRTSRWTFTHEGSWSWDEWTRALCVIRVHERILLVGAGYDSVIRLWNPSDGSEAGVLKGHDAPVLAVCATTLGAEPVLVSAGEDETLRLWDPHTGRRIATWRGHTNAVYSVCAIRAGLQVRVASSGDDHSIRIWDPATGEQKELSEDGGVGRFDVACVIRTETGLLMATSRVSKEHIDIRDPVSWEVVRRFRTGRVNAICVVPFNGRPLLAVADEDIGIWDPQSGGRVRVLKHPANRYTGISSICAIKVGDSPVLVASLGRYLHFWDVSREQAIHGFDAGEKGAKEICPVPVRGRLAVSGITFDGHVRVWDPGSGNRLVQLSLGRGAITAQCAVRIDNRVSLATGNESGVIHLWDLSTQEPLASLEGHSARVRQLWVSVVDGRTVLMSTGDDRTLRVWDPTGARPLVNIPVHHTIVWAAQAGPDITVSLDAGMLGIRLDLSAVGFGRSAKLQPGVSRQRAVDRGLLAQRLFG
ncbi:trypsin-like peptidase domain-containing protein [Streptomyces sp. NPDC050617]|uniref:trypsin-like peptidase domain-containing protein n=1 Tax=Streptomyces sp. NPDC050617 TaxID=3154628 RepID=UPI0034380394